jgi:hypothetical protein
MRPGGARACAFVGMVSIRIQSVVNSDNKTYLTDFQDAGFVGKIRKNRAFAAEIAISICRVYHAAVNYTAAVQNC